MVPNCQVPLERHQTLGAQMPVGQVTGTVTLKNSDGNAKPSPFNAKDGNSKAGKTNAIYAKIPTHNDDRRGETMSPTHAAIAVTRFGMGARPGDIAAATPDPRGYLLAQLSRTDPPFSDTLLSTPQAAKAQQDYRRARAEQRRTGGARAEGAETGAETMDTPSMDGPSMAGMAENDMSAGQTRQPAQNNTDQARRQMLRATLQAEIHARTHFAATTPDGFRERLVRFWSNHFTVSARRANVAPLVGAYEREVIRNGLNGRFADLLTGVVRHPAMLAYLDQAGAIGPDSPVGLRRDRGLNENLAREILELHTLGVDGGYTQTDVEEFAKALTGWTVTTGRGRGPRSANPAGQFVFVDAIHQPGTRTVLGRRYRQDGAEQAQAILNDVARHPATARHIATKLASHFIADTPPQSAIDALERVYLDNDGHLPSLHTALVMLDEPWSPQPAKFKTPEEFLISTLRATNAPEDLLQRNQLRRAFRALGQTPLRAPGPDGWPDNASAWAGPDAVLKRLEWANAVARRAAQTSPITFVDQTLGALADDHTRQTIARAGSPAQGLTLAMMSPQFQRR